MTKAWGRYTEGVHTEDRYTAAVRLERVSQRIRECGRYGFPVTNTDMSEAMAAEDAYDRATAAASRTLGGVGGDHGTPASQRQRPLARP